MNILAEQGTRIGIGKTVVRAEVRLGPVWHKDVRVEAVGSDGKGGIWKAKLSLVKQLSQGVYLYEAAITEQADIMRANVNVRVMPVSPDFCSDFEMELASWG
jgi:starch phosphorylase